MSTVSFPRVGVIGVGYWGSKHVRVLHGLDRVAGVAVIDNREERLRPVLRAFPAVQAFTDLDTALPHIDALLIATPPTTHVPLALKAMSEGKHVLVEKPLATSTADVRTLREAAERNDVVLMAGHTFEYNSAVWRLRDLIVDGALGDLYYIDSSRLNLGLYQSDVNVIWDLAPHDVSVINLLMGRRPSRVDAWAARHAHWKLEDVAYIRLSYEQVGVSANIHVSWLDPCKVRRTTVVGSKMMAVYDDLAAEERIRIHDKGVLPGEAADLTQPPMSYRYGDIVAPFVPAGEPLAVEDGHFVDCITTGCPCRTGPDSGEAVVEVLEAAQISIAEGRPVSLPLATDAAAASPSATSAADGLAGVPSPRTLLAGRPDQQAEFR